MQLFQLLTLLDDQVLPERCKVRLAGCNGSEDPLDVYLAGNFEDWQCAPAGVSLNGTLGSDQAPDTPGRTHARTHQNDCR